MKLYEYAEQYEALRQMAEAKASLRSARRHA